jgi:hypothetical protein
VSVAAARLDTEVRLFAAGIANILREFEPADPLAGVPGNPQSGRSAPFRTLGERAVAVFFDFR